MPDRDSHRVGEPLATPEGPGGPRDVEYQRLEARSRSAVDEIWNVEDHHDLSVDDEHAEDPWDSSPTAHTTFDAHVVEIQPADVPATPVGRQSGTIEPAPAPAAFPEPTARIENNASEVAGKADLPLDLPFESTPVPVPDIDAWSELEAAETELVQAVLEGEAADDPLAGMENVRSSRGDRDPIASAEHDVEPDGPDDDGLLDQSFDEIDYQNELPEATFDRNFDTIDKSAVDPHQELDPDFGIYDFDRTARQRPWEVVPAEDADTATRSARRKAASIVSLIEVSTRQEQDWALDWLTDLFLHLRHAATYRAIDRAAAEGLTMDLLRMMVEVRRAWLERPEWWVGRYGYGGEIAPLPHGRIALTWALARRLCLARADFPPEAMIADEWFEEWKVLGAGEAGYLSFPAYIDVRVAGLDAGSLDRGLWLEHRHNDYRETGDRWDWYQHVSHEDDAVRAGFRVLTPFDERPGSIKGLIRDPQDRERRRAR
ncbi:MAG: hypothetical protein L6R19_08030 [Alphaproteobacteria bacterium]|nr:hypothetical protein [Alphaproteobacteria bacterium]